MRRREFITLLGATSAFPFSVGAQQSGKLPTIGFLGGATWESQWAATFVQRLHELGWTEGRTVAIEYRWTEGRNERAAEIAAEFVRLKVDVIVTYSTPPILAAKQATSAIPIVFAAAGDPVGAGLVASLARPGGNVTGLSLLATDLAGKRIELLREVVPGLRRLAILGNVGNPLVVLEIGEVQAAARKLGLDVVTPSEIWKAEDIVPAFEALKGPRRRAFCRPRPTHQQQPASYCHFSARCAIADDARSSGVGRSCGSYVLWSKFPGPVPAHRRVREQDSARGKTRRNSGRATNQVRSRRQSHHGQGARLAIPDSFLIRDADEVIE